MDFSKFNSMVDLDGLKKDIAAAEQDSSQREYKDVPHGEYEVKISKLELTEAKRSGNPMVTCWMQVVSDGDYKGQMIFMNQVVTQGFQIHLANDFLRSLESGIDVKFEDFEQYADLLMDIAEEIDGKYEYGLDYGENSKGYNTFKIIDVFEV